jgi:hypothetical protein
MRCQHSVGLQAVEVDQCQELSASKCYFLFQIFVPLRMSDYLSGNHITPADLLSK